MNCELAVLLIVIGLLAGVIIGVCLTRPAGRL